jgi:hypothetical protein
MADLSQEAKKEKLITEQENPVFEIDMWKYFIDKRDSVLHQALELMAMISAGSIAVIVSFSSEEPSLLLKTALVFMVLTVLFVLAAFFSISSLFSHHGIKYMTKEKLDPSSKVGDDIGWKMKVAIIAFCLSNLAMVLSVIL